MIGDKDQKSFIMVELDEAILVYIAFSVFMGVIMTILVIKLIMQVLS